MSTDSLAGDVNMLVCTDLAARDLDLQGMTSLVPLSHRTLALDLARSTTCEWGGHHNNGAVMFLKRDDSSAYTVGYLISHYGNSVNAYTRHTCGGDG